MLELLRRGTEDMFLGVLPSWVGDVLSVLGIPAIVLATLMWLLGRKDANRKLEVEEGSLKKSVFDSQTETYQDLLDRANKEAEQAEARAASLQNELGKIYIERDDLFDILRRVRDLFRKVIVRTRIELTPEEEQEWQQTVVPPRTVRRIYSN